MAEIPNLAVATGSIERVAFSPKEFAALFGKSQTWGYRQIYADKVSTITEYGRILIPAAEVERILATAGVYDGKKPLIQRSKAELQKLAPKLAEAWAAYLSKRRILSKRRPQESINAVLMAHQKLNSSRRKIEPTGSALSILAARKKTRRRSD